jgi:hypothetical protein
LQRKTNFCDGVGIIEGFAKPLLPLRAAGFSTIKEERA